SMLGDSGLNKTNVKAEECRAMVEQQKWDQATNCWNEAEVLIEALTDGVSFYNVLEREGLDRRSLRLLTHVERLFEKHVRPFEGDDLNLLMNGAVRKKLKIIPDSVQWTESSQAVFTHQSGDFMKPVIDTVDWLLVNTPLNVSVYNGQLDLICDTIGTELWVSRLRWPDLRKFSARDRLAFHVGNDDSRTAGFYKQYNNFRFFWIMRAGHMVPSDNPAAALKMVDMIISH
uniref:Retinoid-inducible serine carboxypeptidase n=1 Tax=Plectus sambesii TaxID=2011161 RepID=A0A914WGU4_9BILA